jgi:hypothetical protein
VTVAAPPRQSEIERDRDLEQRVADLEALIEEARKRARRRRQRLGASVLIAGAAFAAWFLGFGGHGGGADTGALASASGAHSPAAKPALPFKAEAGRICHSLKKALDASPLPASVERAVKAMPVRATKAQNRIWGNWYAKHMTPQYQRALSRFEALGQPTAGAPTWTRFLDGFQLYVTALRGEDHQYQLGNNGSMSRAYHKLILARRQVIRSAAAAGTTFCLRVM